MKNKTMKIKQKYALSYALHKLGVEFDEKDFEATDAIEDGDIVMFTIPFAGSREGLTIYAGPNYHTGYTRLLELIDDSIRFGIDAWPYESMSEREQTKMKAFLYECADKLPEAILTWEGDGSVMDVITYQEIESRFNIE